MDRFWIFMGIGAGVGYALVYAIASLVMFIFDATWTASVFTGATVVALSAHELGHKLDNFFNGVFDYVVANYRRS